jgi:transcriptional regulator with XRE-family HTH domain
MESINAIFGKRLRSIRKARGLTQEQLGRAAKVDYKHVGSIERGIHPPSFAAVERIARVLKVEFYELFASDRVSTPELQQHLQALLPEIHKLDVEGVQEFFDDLTNAVRKLQTRRRG